LRVLKKLVYIPLLLFSINNIFAQPNLDSLWATWSDINQEDTVRLDALNDFVWEGYLFSDPDSAFYFSQIELDFAKSKGLKSEMGNALQTQGVSFAIRNDYEKAIDYFTQCLEIVEEIDDKQGIASSLSNIGNIYKIQGEFDAAFNFYNRSLSIAREINDKESLASVYTNLGIIFRDQGNYSESIEHFTRGLKLNEELGDNRSITISLNNIGVIYKNQGDYPNALVYYKRCLEIEKEMNDKQGIAISLNNIGIMHKKEGNLDIALECYNKSLTIATEFGDKRSMANALDNIGNVYIVQKEFSKANHLFFQSLALLEEMGDEQGIAGSLINLGSAHFNEGRYEKAIELNLKALKISEKVGAVVETKLAASCLYQTYKVLNQDERALEMFELFITMRDSISNADNQKEIIRQEYKYQYEKEATEDSIVNAESQKVKDALLSAEKAENKQHQLEARQQKQQAYFLYGGLGLAILFGGFIFNRFRVTNGQKEIIEEQKSKVDSAFDELEEKNTEIMDSIAYAKRIQSAILPPSKLVKEYLRDSFILYKPKDIVAGDFYWMEHQGGKILFAAADCTGHGVPGAMVSVVCNNGLNRSVREHGLTDPANILDKTREIVIQEFEKSEEEVKDGMDIALCSLEGKKLKYAGAHNPLWIVRPVISSARNTMESVSRSEQELAGSRYEQSSTRTDSQYEIIETKANKQPIGKFDKQTAYTTHSFDLETGDSIYIFTDGFVDQFGGEKGKKFKAKAFRNLLLSVQNKSMEEQKVIIDDAFEAWRGSLEQIDDVCIIGVRV